MHTEDQLMLNEDQGMVGLLVLGMLKDLFSESPIQSFTRKEVVDFIYSFMRYEDLFSLESRIRYMISDTMADQIVSGNMATVTTGVIQ